MNILIRKLRNGTASMSIMIHTLPKSHAGAGLVGDVCLHPRLVADLLLLEALHPVLEELDLQKTAGDILQGTLRDTPVSPCLAVCPHPDVVAIDANRLYGLVCKLLTHEKPFTIPDLGASAARRLLRLRLHRWGHS